MKNEAFVLVDGQEISSKAKAWLENYEPRIQFIQKEFEQHMQKFRERREESITRRRELREGFLDYFKNQAAKDFDFAVDGSSFYKETEHKFLFFSWKSKVLCFDCDKVIEKLIELRKDVWEECYRFDISDYIDKCKTNGNVKPCFKGFCIFMKDKAKNFAADHILRHLHDNFYRVPECEYFSSFFYQNERVYLHGRADLMKKYENVVHDNLYMPINDYNQFMTKEPEFENV